MAEQCGSQGAGDVFIFTCAGAAHSGQVANRAGVKLTQQGAGKLFCIAAVGAQVEEKVEKTRTARCRVAVDGCDDHCCRKVLERADMPVDFHYVVTDLGVEKTGAGRSLIDDSKTVTDQIAEALSSST